MTPTGQRAAQRVVRFSAKLGVGVAGQPKSYPHVLRTCPATSPPPGATGGQRVREERETADTQGPSSQAS